MATLLDVPPAIMAIGKAIVAAAAEAKAGIEELERATEEGRTNTSSMSRAGGSAPSTMGSGSGSTDGGTVTTGGQIATAIVDELRRRAGR